MAMKFSFGKVEIGVQRELEAAQQKPSEETPFRIVVLGDFSGRSSRGLRDAARLRGLRPLPVDRDNFEEVMARLGVELRLPMGGEAGTRMSIRFRELDDFRPDRIFAQVEVFEKLRETRRQLGNASTFAAAAAEVSSWAPPTVPPSPAVETPAASPISSEDLLDQILSVTQVQAEAAPTLPGGGDWNQFLHKVVASYVVPREDPRQAELIGVLDAATSGLMRAMLHQADFQALEAAWRGLFFLVRRLDTDANLKLYLLDVSRAELAADLADADELTTTGLYRLLVEQTVGTPGAQPWSVLAGNYTFGPGKSDVELLGRLAQVARQAGAPFLAAASPAVVGCPSFGQSPELEDWKTLDADAQEAWSTLRNLEESAYVGLAMPRFLLRLPHGQATDPVEAFDFEEVTAAACHEAYLWGNPALACTYLLAESFSRQGWNMRPGVVQDIEGLPLHVHEQDGESVVKPCAEAVLGHRAAAVIGDAGVMPLLSFQGRDAVRLDRFCSLSSALPALAGRWRGQV